MPLPKHIKCVPEDRKAVAPYNFVELPEKIVEAEPLPSGDRYHDISEYKVDGEEIKLKRHTGTIKCTLTTESPLYTRCGWTPDDFAKYGDKPFHELPPEIQKKRANFFLDPVTQEPVIPGSSIRGMLRTLVEIVSFSKIDRVSDAQKFFFRAVAAEKEDPLAEPYKKTLKKVQAGYLVKKGDEWFIRPAKKVDGLSFVWIKDKLVDSAIDGFTPLTDEKYYPQYKINISFEDTVLKNGRRFARKISVNPNQYKYVGVLVTSGNMAETGEALQTNRKNHCLVREPDTDGELLKISDEAIRSYCSALTTFQKKKSPHFTEQEGFLAKGRCVFYCMPQKMDECIFLFGQSPYFRIPYLPIGNDKAATARDFIPPRLKDIKDQPIILDMAEAMFGFVRRDKQTEQLQQARSGRIFISNAIPQPEQEANLQASLEREAQEILLSSPKPTTFQHYLVQPEAKQKVLKHYASSPPKENEPGDTVIRGHKLYWHKEYKGLSVPENSDSQTSLIKPLDSGIKFDFDIRFENLSDVELGALLWVLSLSSDKSEKLQTGKAEEKYCFSLGMGKPLGMGAVTIDYALYLSDRPQRHQKLFSGSDWEKAEHIATIKEQQKCINAFESSILHPKDGISNSDYPEGKTPTKLREIPRIEMLLAMLQCDSPGESIVEYMDLEAFKERKVLPNPLDIRGISDQRQFLSNNNPSSSGAGRSDRSTVSPPTVQSAKQESSPFSEGQQIEAKVVDIQVQEGNKRKTTITYEINDSNCPAREEVYKRKVNLAVGDVVKVTIDKAQGRNIRKVKHL
jgi:CRISPR-associated protein (TIGR03986 family)